MANHSQQEYTPSPSPLYSASECIAWLTVFGMEAVAMVTLNALTIIVYLKERSLRKRSMYLVINQAVADMLVAGSLIIGFCSLGSKCKFWTWTNSSNLPSVIVIRVWFFFFPLASVTNLAAISLERMHATFRPFKHCLIKKNMFGAAVAAVWITAGLCSATGAFYPFTIKLSRSLFTFYLTFSLFCLLIILVSFTSIAIKIIHGNQPHHHGATSRERKLTKTLFIVTVVSLLLTQPKIIFWILRSVPSHSFTAISHQTRFRLYCIFGLIFCANSLFNPVCYAFRIPEFRKALFSFLRCRFQPQPAQILTLKKM
ncbi:PREDICTED: adrenocorticotropic hormone receptor-like isoform X1 [Acropora digitifera]|uniref:adrenocorticotropic hormone receptor-like isoform X1 n=1 Tax=Acropora digitifera TaxID=70779 RepID=UPI00077ABD9C|nr:PREDICTED: adrenocorticotropic hormone receptor-like isoform X1 [Acropora digitifera]